MNMKAVEGFCLIFFILSSFRYSEAKRRYGTCFFPEAVEYENAMYPCTEEQFRCSNGRCIERVKYCDGSLDCRKSNGWGGYDNDLSDEEFCQTENRCPPDYFSCYVSASCTDLWCNNNLQGCIPKEFLCDNLQSCSDGTDEENCGPVITQLSKDVQASLGKAVLWMKNQVKSTSANEKWGNLVHKKAVALFLGNGNFFTAGNSETEDIGYETSLKLLSLLSRSRLQDIPSTDLAAFVNALLITCFNVRDFHGHNLIAELRSRVNRRNYTNPYVFLTLCNAGDKITESDREKLISCFNNKRREFWTDIKALVVMALSCARNQSESVVSDELLQRLTTELKRHQYRNGTVENLQTTALVVQALYAAETTDDPDSFDEEKALQQILQHQKPDGSFGSFMKTYYVLPILNCRSLVNISDHHCLPSSRNEETAEQYLLRQKGPKVHTEYSIWIGNERYMERTLALRLPINTTLYGMMEIASDLDPKYKFEYVIKNRKPYVNGLSGYLDDPESGRFWFLYALNDTQPTLIQKSPVDVVLKDREHFVMWYRRGPWVESNTPLVKDNVESK